MIGAIATAAGGLLSAGIGAYGAAQERKAADKRRNQANQQISEWQRQAEQILRESEANRMQLSDPSAVKTYKSLRDSYDPSSFILEPEKFDKNAYSVEDYLNPAKDAVLSDIRKQVQGSAAGAAMGHSSGAAEAIGKAVLDKSEQFYNDAYNRMKEERSFDYGAYTDYINQQQKRLDSMQQGYRTQLETLRGDIQFDQQQTDATLANRLSLGNAIAQSRAQLV